MAFQRLLQGQRGLILAVLTEAFVPAGATLIVAARIDKELGQFQIALRVYRNRNAPPRFRAVAIEQGELRQGGFGLDCDPNSLASTIHADLKRQDTLAMRP